MNSSEPNTNESLVEKIKRTIRGSAIRAGIKTADGRTYGYGINGNLVRLSPVKPYKNKAEQKRYLKARRQARLEAL